MVHLSVLWYFHSKFFVPFLTAHCNQIGLSLVLTSTSTPLIFCSFLICCNHHYLSNSLEDFNLCKSKLQEPNSDLFHFSNLYNFANYCLINLMLIIIVEVLNCIYRENDLNLFFLHFLTLMDLIFLYFDFGTLSCYYLNLLRRNLLIIILLDQISKPYSYWFG